MVPRHPRWTRPHFSDDDLDAIARAVTAAESLTSAEIRVHLERRLPRAAGADTLARAREVFHRLGMQHTRDRNGVLIYLALGDRRFAILGDEAIHRQVGDAYWERVRDVMVEELRSGAARDAIVAAVGDVAAVLQKFFPRRPDDTNELSDRVSLG
jgi:uncharacterized membrane protein